MTVPKSQGNLSCRAAALAVPCRASGTGPAGTPRPVDALNQFNASCGSPDAANADAFAALTAGRAFTGTDAVAYWGLSRSVEAPR